jgi:hypothetical protein
MYFEYIKNQPDPFAFLANIPASIETEPVFEDEWLDFKGFPQNDDAKKIWSKALSGYANTTDGLIIWGIDARKVQPRNIDAASGLRLVSDPPAFESKLRDWIRDATNPPIMNIEYQSFTNVTGEGFVICLIPKSMHKPHRAEFADKQYYFRAGDDFLIAGPDLLRTLFYPESKPYLWLEVGLYFQLNPIDLAKEYHRRPTGFAYNKLINSTSSMTYSVMLHNTGTATAKDVYVVVQTKDELNFWQETDWVLRENPQGRAAFQAKRPIHPGEIVDLFSAGFQKEFYNRQGAPDSWEIFPHFDPVTLRFMLYADNFQQQEITFTFSSTELNYETCSIVKKGIPIPVSIEPNDTTASYL